MASLSFWSFLLNFVYWQETVGFPNLFFFMNSLDVLFCECVSATAPFVFVSRCWTEWNKRRTWHTYKLNTHAHCRVCTAEMALAIIEMRRERKCCFGEFMKGEERYTIPSTWILIVLIEQFFFRSDYLWVLTWKFEMNFKFGRHFSLALSTTSHLQPSFWQTR